MRHINIGLLLPSVIQAIGIGSILRRVQDGNITVAEIPASTYLEEIAKAHVSVLIVDPSVPGIDWEALKSASSQPLKIIALLSQQYPQSLLRWFDDTFSIYDTAESIMEILRRNINTEEAEDRGKDLSPREKEVIVGIVKGLSNKEIASEMGVSVNTVMTHRRNIASKLHIHTPAGLTIYAIVSNLVKLDEIKADMEKL